MEEPRVLQPLDHERYPARLVEIRGHVATAGFQVAEQRSALADPVEIVDLQLDPDLAGHGQKMKYAIGGSAAARDRRDRVLKALTRDDVAWPLPACEHVDDQPARLGGHFGLLGVDRWDHREPRGRDAQDLEGHGHRVGGDLASAG